MCQGYEFPIYKKDKERKAKIKVITLLAFFIREVLERAKVHKI